MIRAMIADDEALARNELSYLLGSFGDVQIVGTAEDGAEAVERVKETRPDLLFLDIQMPERDGLQVVRDLTREPNLPYVVFVTAYDQHALRAFELHALDYLLKPVDPERLRDCMERVRKNLVRDGRYRKELENWAETAGPRKSQKSEFSDLIAVKRGGRIYAQPVNEILYLRVEQGIVEVFTRDGWRMTNFTSLDEVEDRLDPDVFFRTHRSFIVNRKSIREIVPLSNQTFHLRLNGCDDAEIPLSRTQARKFRQLMRF